MLTVESFWRTILEGLTSEPIKIPGMKEAYLIKDGGNPVGMVMRTGRNAAFATYVGVGKGAKYIGSFHSDATMASLKRGGVADMTGAQGGGLKAAIAAIQRAPK